jgi:hypothetical protein
MPLLTTNEIADLCDRYDTLEKAYKQAKGLGADEFAAWKTCEKELSERMRAGMVAAKHTEAPPWVSALAFFTAWALLRGGYPT